MERPACHVYRYNELVRLDSACKHTHPAEPMMPIPDIPGVIAVCHPDNSTPAGKALADAVADAIESFVATTGKTVWYVVTELNTWHVFTICNPGTRIYTTCDGITRAERNASGEVVWELEQAS